MYLVQVLCTLYDVLCTMGIQVVHSTTYVCTCTMSSYMYIYTYLYRELYLVWCSLFPWDVEKKKLMPVAQWTYTKVRCTRRREDKKERKRGVRGWHQRAFWLCQPEILRNAIFTWEGGARARPAGGRWTIKWGTSCEVEVRAGDWILIHRVAWCGMVVKNSVYIRVPHRYTKAVQSYSGS